MRARLYEPAWTRLARRRRAGRNPPCATSATSGHERGPEHKEIRRGESVTEGMSAADPDGQVSCVRLRTDVLISCLVEESLWQRRRFESPMFLARRSLMVRAPLSG